MKTIKNIALVLVAVTMSISLLSSCSGGGNSASGQPTGNSIPPININVGDKPLNISVYLDLSDRIQKEIDGMTQTEKDTAIINHLVDIFYSSIVKKKAKDVVDKMKVFFYPTSNISEVNKLSKNLVVDLKAATDKLTTLTGMKDKFQSTLGEIYASALDSNNYPGSDLWGYFNEQADVQCIRNGYRNILVILTDGYVYHQNNLVREGNAWSYINKNSLAAGRSLLVKKTGLNDLEVLMLEINPNPNTDYPKLKGVLENWLVGMGVEKYRIVKTDTSTNTAQFIENFFAQ